MDLTIGRALRIIDINDIQARPLQIKVFALALNVGACICILRYLIKNVTKVFLFRIMGARQGVP